MGGIAVAEVGEDIVEALWITADKKGANVPMLSHAMAAVSQHDAEYEEEDREYWAEQPEEEVHRPIGLMFQFVEVCGGAGKVTERLSRLGFSCGPVLDLSLSKHYNIAEHRVISWVAFMLEQDRLESFLVAPPCTTFRVNMKVELLNKPCTRDHAHIPIQGSFTKPSATYTDELSQFLADFFAEHLRARQKSRERLAVKTEGLESLVTNDLAAAVKWSPLAAWRWQHTCHINILESYATLKLFREVARGGGDIRFADNIEPYMPNSNTTPSALLMDHPDNAYIRCVGFLFVRFGLAPDSLWNWLGEYVLDDEELRPAKEPLNHSRERMGNMVGTQCPPWGGQMASAVRDAYEELEADHDIQLTPAYEYNKLEPENADQKLYNGFFRRALLSGIPVLVQQEPESEVAAKLKINGELTMIQIEDTGKSCRNINLHSISMRTIASIFSIDGFENVSVQNDEMILVDLTKCRQVNVIGHGIRKRLNQQLQLAFSDGRTLLLRFTDMEHRHVCGHVLPLLVDAILGRTGDGPIAPGKTQRRWLAVIDGRCRPSNDDAEFKSLAKGQIPLYYSTVLPRLPMSTKRQLEAKLAPIPQSRKRSKSNLAFLEVYREQGVKVEISHDGEWLTGSTLELIEDMPSRLKVLVKMEDDTEKGIVIRVGTAKLWEMKTDANMKILHKLIGKAGTGETDEPQDDSMSVGDLSDMESEWDPCETPGPGFPELRELPDEFQDEEANSAACVLTGTNSGHFQMISHGFAESFGWHQLGRLDPDGQRMNIFNRMGFDDEGIASSYTKSGCPVRHDGKAGVGMAGGKAWTPNWLTFDNSYFQFLKRSKDDNLLWLPTDAALHEDAKFKARLCFQCCRSTSTASQTPRKLSLRRTAKHTPSSQSWAPSSNLLKVFLFLQLPSCKQVIRLLSADLWTQYQLDCAYNKAIEQGGKQSIEAALRCKTGELKSCRVTMEKVVTHCNGNPMDILLMTSDELD
eukprot:s1889_g3.t1